MTDLSGCKAGQCDLKTIYVGRTDAMSEEVVRWCATYGSIVVDVDFDGRTNPGQIMKMRSPKVTRDLL